MMVRRYKVSFGGDENVLKLVLVIVAKLCYVLKPNESYTFSE